MCNHEIIAKSNNKNKSNILISIDFRLCYLYPIVLLDMTHPEKHTLPKENFIQRLRNDLESFKRPLTGKVALITGSSRDIGAEIAMALAKEGVNIFGNYRDKEKRATNVQTAISNINVPVKSKFVQADITNEQDRKKLKDTLLNSFRGKLDFLILNASGPTEEINVVANNALVDQFFPFMPRGSTIVFMQSVPGHFEQDYPDLVPEFYQQIAKAKHAGEKSLISRAEEFKEKGINFIIICPPEVPDTSNMKRFTRIDPQVSEKHAKFSKMLGIPEIVSKKQVGEKVAKLLRRKNLPIGYIEFFKS